MTHPDSANPFAGFAGEMHAQDGLRKAISAAHHRPEIECLPELLQLATMPRRLAERIHARALTLVESLRARQPVMGMTALMNEYSLSTSEGIALMSLAEALLRTPDMATRDALVRDKISKGKWGEHMGTDKSLFVNASSWALLLTGRITRESVDESGLAKAMSGLVARGGEPFIRQGVDTAMRLLGDQFVSGQTIAEALKRARKSEAKGFRYSYDMLGEAAMNADDAARYYDDYEKAILAIGAVSEGRDIYDGPGISIKLSALHPRYERAQRDRVMGELLPRVTELCKLAAKYNIGLNIDAEEADRLMMSLDILEALAMNPDLKDWQGLGFVVQAYGKRAPYVVDFLSDLAKRSGHRLMVRLVKGAYWDTEIKHAQELGHADYPVFTRKVHTDVAYLACVSKLLAVPDLIYPQFATHNAQTVAHVMEVTEGWAPGKFEFQCLYGMGEALYRDIVAEGGNHVPCRIYAPVGSHNTLLAYLVRRLLENGANSSFVNQVSDPDMDLEAMVADPVEEAKKVSPIGAPHPAIPLPQHFLGERLSPLMPDLNNDDALHGLTEAFSASAEKQWVARPTIDPDGGTAIDILNPANHADKVGVAYFADSGLVDKAMDASAKAAPGWAGKSAEERAVILEKAGDLLQNHMAEFSGLIVREAGKTAANALGDVREAIDFLRYYAAQGRERPDAEALGTVVCISPWNFPLAIFLGQVSGALAVGNAVIAKPAEETPLIAAAAIGLLHHAGVPEHVVQLMPGAGDVGAALVDHSGVGGVMFTGSTEVGQLIAKSLSTRIGRDGRPIPLIAETGGQNALIVDSSALAEQVVADVMQSAFDSAGQRCSALRLLCLQDDVADRLGSMIRGAMEELRVAAPTRLTADVGPVISAEARDGINSYIEERRKAGFAIDQLTLDNEASRGTFVPPTIVELNDVSDLGREVFGPVLHVIRFKREDRVKLVERINALGYGLTFGLHTRLDSEIDKITAVASAGNIYVNRNIVGAVVGVQPFGGHGLSGTGPKAGGPLYLNRMIASGQRDLVGRVDKSEALETLLDWAGDLSAQLWEGVVQDMRRSPLNYVEALPSPAGETDTYSILPRGNVLVMPVTEEGLVRQLSAVMVTGAVPVIDAASPLIDRIPESLGARIQVVADPLSAGRFDAALLEGNAETIKQMCERLAEREGPLVVVQSASSDELASAGPAYQLDLLVREQVVSINTAAAGGNASLMTLEANPL